MQYLYKIAGLHIICQLPFSVHICKESKNFIYSAENSNSYDLAVLFQAVKELESPNSEGFWDIDRYYVQEYEIHKVYYCPAPHQKPYACVRWQNSERNQIECRYIQGKENYLNYSRNLCDIIALDSLLLSHQGLLLHSSFIRYQGYGILFSAPSGTGKSTQADLWVNYENAEIINGDRAGLRCIDENWNAYGLPYAGSSGIYRNESAPIKAIIALRQAKENHIRALHPMEALLYLYPEVTIHHWDKIYTEKALNLLTELVNTIPIYLLECLPNQEAVELVKQTIFFKEQKGGQRNG